MKNLIVNGVDFQGELPEEWTIGQLVQIIEREVLDEGELVVTVHTDGEDFTGGDWSRTLAETERLEIVANHVSVVMSEAVATSKNSLVQFENELTTAVESFQVGEEPRGWHAYRRSLLALSSFVNVAEQLDRVMNGGVADGEAHSQKIRSFSVELGQHLAEMEQASGDEDVVALCDSAEELTAWSLDAWNAVWAVEQ